MYPASPFDRRMRDNEGVAVQDVPACPLCGADGQDLYTGLRDRLWDAPGTWSLRVCPACGHVWLDPRPVPDAMAMLYGSYYTHQPPPERPPSSAGLAARRAVLADLGYGDTNARREGPTLGRLLRLAGPYRESFERHVRLVRGPPRGTLLDVGCGDGSFLATMRALGWGVQGLEPDPAAAAIARERHGIDVIERPIERLESPPDRCGAITMNHVIEHVHDPVRALEACRRALIPGGQLVVVTPNVESQGHRTFGKAWFHLDPPRHFHLFRPGTLRSTAERAGLRIADVRTSALGAMDVRRASLVIRAHGRVDLRNPASPPSLRDRLFEWGEYTMTWAGRDAGEEILLTATK